MSKDIKPKKSNCYFSHDANAKDDYKCMLVIEELGLEGYGIFWVLVETLREQETYKYPLRLLPSLARKYNTTHAKMEVVITNYDLFKIDKENFFFSESLNNRMSIMEKSIEQRRQAGIASGKARRIQKKERLLNGRSTDDKQIKETKGKEIKEIINKKSVAYYDFQKRFLEEHSGSLNFELPYPFNYGTNFIEGTIISLKKNGYFYNITAQKDLNKQQAFSIWDYLFENIDNIKVR